MKRKPSSAKGIASARRRLAVERGAMNQSDMPDPSDILRVQAALAAGVGPAAQVRTRDRYAYEAGWPADVWSIGLDRLDLLGVDAAGNLYWDGRAVEYRKPLVLTTWQRLTAAVVALAAVIAAVAGVVQAWAAVETLERAKPAIIAQARVTTNNR